MAHRPRIYYSAEQKADIWGHWQPGESLCSIGRVFDRYSSSIYKQFVASGGIPGKVSLVDVTPVVDGLVQHSYFLDTPKVVSDMRQVLADTPSDEISGRKYVNRDQSFPAVVGGKRLTRVLSSVR